MIIRIAIIIIIIYATMCTCKQFIIVHTLLRRVALGGLGRFSTRNKMRVAVYFDRSRRETDGRSLESAAWIDVDA